MNSDEIRQKFLDFFNERGHTIVPSSSLVPDNDPTTLFTASGMQPMLPFLLGAKHPSGTRIADSQKSFRTVDIDEVGDNRHTTFFEMLGNWSLGDYFKEEQLTWIFQFLTDELEINPERIYVTAFIGDEKNNLPRDDESVEIWKKLFKNKNIEAESVLVGSEENAYRVGMQGGRIFLYDARKNWWSRAGSPENMPSGEPGGPDSEIFYEFTDVVHDKKFGENCHPNCDCGRFLEIGNNVFMEYLKDPSGSFLKLPQRNVDFGGGLERIAMAVNNNNDVFEINHKPIISFIEQNSNKTYKEDQGSIKAFRIITDHMKAACFLISDGVHPSNNDQGYFVRRLIRRAVRYSDLLGIKESILSGVVVPISEMYKDSYPEIFNRTEIIKRIIDEEESKFRKTLENGLKEFNKGADPFILFSTYGFPIELTQELAKEKGLEIDMSKFQSDLDKHKELSRTGSEQKFKGGLGGHSEMEIKYHTATHLLHKALRDVLGEGVEQKGSNITPERLRFDFSHPQKMTDEEKKKVEEIINEKISESLPVNKVIMKKDEAEKVGALHFFGDKYGDEVSVYYIGESLENAYSKEFCGGPHVENIGNLGKFKIIKEEAVSAGVRRIKAVLE